MTFSDLKFMPGDFEPLVGYHSEQADKVAALVNRVLQERLKKATLAFGRRKGQKIYWQSPPPWRSYADVMGVIIVVGEVTQQKDGRPILPLLPVPASFYAKTASRKPR